LFCLKCHFVAVTVETKVKEYIKELDMKQVCDMCDSKFGKFREFQGHTLCPTCFVKVKNTPLSLVLVGFFFIGFSIFLYFAFPPLPRFVPIIVVGLGFIAFYKSFTAYEARKYL
jgi:hypothetical protein